MAPEKKISKLLYRPVRDLVAFNMQEQLDDQISDEVQDQIRQISDQAEFQVWGEIRNPLLDQLEDEEETNGN